MKASQCSYNTADLPRDAHLSELLDAFTASIESERVDLGAISACMGHRSIAALLLILALPMALPVPAPGVSVIFGIPMIVVAGELLLGRRSVWLPPSLARRSVTRAEFVAMTAKAMPLLRRLEKIVRPRAAWLAGDWTLVPVGAVCLVLALIITLPIPLGHMVPGTAVSLLALGIIERDGVTLGIGFLVAALSLVIVSFASISTIALLRGWL